MRYPQESNLSAFQGRTLGLIPGVMAILAVAGFRLFGGLQPLEWKALDVLMRLRPTEIRDERITIVAIDETDIVEQLKTYPISDDQLTALLKAIASYRPRVIGLDIFRDLPVEPGHAQLTQVFKQTPNIIGIERILSPPVTGPPSLPQEQIGFADALLDEDGFLRRSLLGVSHLKQEYRLSFTIQVAQHYLKSKEISLENGLRDSEAMRFGNVELHRFRPNTGGYVNADSEGNQILVNVRSGKQPFRRVSLGQVMAGKVQPEWLKDRIVLVGVVAPSAKDFVNSGAIQSSNSGLIPGIEFQAHAISQLTSAVLDKRPLLHSFPDVWEYLAIVLGGVLGLGFVKWRRSPLQQLINITLGLLGCIGISYIFLCFGLWLPIIPVGLVFLLNGTIAYSFYLYEQGIRAQIRERQTLIEQVFGAIHNGPLQSLGSIQRQLDETDWLPQDFKREIASVDDTLRKIYEDLRQKTVSQGTSVYLTRNSGGDINLLLHELLEEIYFKTMERNFPCFKSIKIKIKDLGPLAEENLSLTHKQAIAHWFEEALCNVGKYATNTTRLTVTSQQCDGYNIIQVIDNGMGLHAIQEPRRLKSLGGYGTKQAEQLAFQLGGKFQRCSAKPKGTHCELRWPIRPSFWVRLGRFLSGA